MTRRSVALAAAVSVVVGAAAVVAVVAKVPLVNGEVQSASGCRVAGPDPADARRPLWVVLAGHNGSDADDGPAHVEHLRSVVLPAAAAASARVIVALIEADSDREPRVVADLRFAASGPAADNPEVQRRAHDRASSSAVACLTASLAAPPAPRSDPFGAVAWASTVLSTTPAGRRHLVMLTDAVSTTANCNLSGRDLRPTARSSVLADCAPELSGGLAGATVWLAGVGLGAGTDPAPGASDQALTPEVLVELWRQFFTAHGAELTRAGVTLLPGSG